jgi:hypothetical protein
MNKNTNTVLIILGIIILVGAMLFWGRFSDNTAVAGYWPGTDVECLPKGHEGLALHIHPVVSIFVDGEEEAIPGNLGISGVCMAEVHTHDTDGVLHVESVHPGKEFTLEDFFKVWGQSIEREGLDLTMTVQGEPSDEFGNLVLRDRQQIVLEYSSIGESEEDNLSEEMEA